MKRLLRISFDLSLLSFIPLISWFFLGIIIDKNLINIFSLTYPLQFIYYIICSVFSTGANINFEKDNNKNAVMSGIVIGSIISTIIFALILLNIDKYITFMNMDISIYKTFTIYSVLELYISLLFTMVLNKLHFERKNKLANKYSLAFNLMNFILLIGSAILIKNQILIILITLIPLFIFDIYIMLKHSDKFVLKLDIKKCIRYDSVQLVNNIAFLFIFLFGLSNALDFGPTYATALTFVALITDTQWDTFEAIAALANIDISEGTFNYKKHIKNAYKLLGILFSTILIMFISLYAFYDLDFKITMIYFSFELINFIIFPIYRLKTCYLQIEWSALKITSNKLCSSILRLLLSFLKTPFCTGIGQVTSSIYQFISVSIMFKRNYRVLKDGKVVIKQQIALQ